MIVSLGSTCSVAYQLQHFEKRTEAYPFDWLRTDSLADITTAIKDGFNSFMDVIEIDESDKFPVFDPEVETFPNNIQDNSYSNIQTSKSIIMKNKYNMKFYHDFSENTDIKLIQEKYKRRVERFINLIVRSKYICFVRDELKANKISSEQIEDFLGSIRNINPSIQITFILIIHNPKNKNFDILNYKDYCVKIINDTKPYGHWIRPNVSWANMFSNE